MSTITSAQEFDSAHTGGLIPLLQGVPSEVIEQFRKNLVFAEGGLAHSDYSMLKGYVADEDLPDLFNQFGIEPARFNLIKDTSCVNRVCFVHPGAFCDPDRCRNS